MSPSSSTPAAADDMTGKQSENAAENAVQSPASATPTIRRRLLAMVYETFLVLAVAMLAEGLAMLVTLNNQGPAAQFGRKVFLFLAVGAYFVHFWSDSGHTLAMKTWRMRLVTVGGARVPRGRAVLRYLLAWGWFLPALAACALLGIKGKGEVGIALAIGVAAWAASALFDRDRQFLHDRLAGTRVVSLPGTRKR